MQLAVWLDESDIEAIASENGQTEQDVLDEISEAIAEFCGQKYGIIINTETEE
jgi:hypothetical protein